VTVMSSADATLMAELDNSDAEKMDAATPPIVLFDFDGVLIHGDAFYLFIRQRYVGSLWRPLLALVCAPLLLVLALFSRRLPARILVRIALLGVGETRYQAMALAFAATLARRPRQFCRDGLHALRRHQATGDRVIVVTGCEQVLVNGILQQLAQHGVAAWQVAYSDSLQDVPMLKPATQVVLVNGTPTLCKKVEKALGRSITRVEWF